MATCATSDSMVQQYHYSEIMNRGDLIISNCLSPHAIHLSSASYMFSSQKQVAHRMTSISSKLGVHNFPPTERKSGELCTFKEGRRWKRAYIWKPNLTPYTISLDTGAVKPVGKRGIYRCPEDLLSIKRGVIKVALNNVKPINGKCWGKIERDFVSTFNSEKVTFVPHKEMGETIVGEIVFLSTGLTLNDMMVQLGFAQYTPYLEECYPMGVSLFCI